MRPCWPVCGDGGSRTDGETTLIDTAAAQGAETGDDGSTSTARAEASATASVDGGSTDVDASDDSDDTDGTSEADSPDSEGPRACRHGAGLR